MTMASISDTEPHPWIDCGYLFKVHDKAKTQQAYIEVMAPSYEEAVAKLPAAIDALPNVAAAFLLNNRVTAFIRTVDFRTK